MNLDIKGESIERISFDYAVTLLTDGGAELRIESAFVLAQSDGEITRVEPETPADSAGQLCRILHETVTEASVGDHNETLTLKFGNGTRIEVGANDSYESWTFNGGDGVKVVSQPGGDVAVWDPTG